MLWSCLRILLPVYREGTHAGSEFLEALRIRFLHTVILKHFGISGRQNTSLLNLPNMLGSFVE